MSENEPVTINKEFKILAILACGDGDILISMIPVEERVPNIDEKPVFRTEEERVGWEMGTSMMKAIMALSPIPPPNLRSVASTSPYGLTIKIPQKDYQTLGSPTVNAILVLGMRAFVKGG